MNSSNERNEFIKDHFLRGFSYNEIIDLLEKNQGEKLSLRQLHRILRKGNLFRRKNKSSLNLIIDFVDSEIRNTSGSCFGYRTMHQKLRLKGLTTDRDTVRLVLKNLDPDGVEERLRKKLRRRQYISKGPNFTWHIDGYDKLKPYGFPIHACIDGFSRKIIWLKVGTTNNDPSIVGSYFLNSIEKLHKVPRLVRSDRGSENVKICGFQRFFRRDHDDTHAGSKSFLYGKSTSNQRIESWWSIFRKGRMNWWMNFFKDLIDQNVFDPSIDYHVNLARLCFMKVLQNELDETSQMWNSHTIRVVRNSECPGGRPDVLYSCGEIECGFEVTDIDLIAAKEQVDDATFIPDENLKEFMTIIANENNLSTESKMPDAKFLFIKLIEEIDSI